MEATCKLRYARPSYPRRLASQAEVLSRCLRLPLCVRCDLAVSLWHAARRHVLSGTCERATHLPPSFCHLPPSSPSFASESENSFVGCDVGRLRLAPPCFIHSALHPHHNYSCLSDFSALISPHSMPSNAPYSVPSCASTSKLRRASRAPHPSLFSRLPRLLLDQHAIIYIHTSQHIFSNTFTHIFKYIAQ